MRIKSIFASFLIVFSVSTVCLLVFLQTESFGRLITKVITDLTEKKVGAKVSVKNIFFTIYPLGITFQNFKLEKKINDGIIFFESGGLSLNLNLMEIEDRRLSFGEINFNQAYLNFQNRSDEKQVEEIPEKILEEVFKYPEKLPLAIDTVVIENSKIIYNDFQVNIKRFKTFKENKTFKTRLHLSSPNIPSDINVPIDEIAGQVDITKKNIKIHKLRILSEVNTLEFWGDVKNFPKLKKSMIEIQGESFVNLSFLNEKLLPSKVLISEGEAKGNFKFLWKNEDPDFDAKILIDDLSSNLLDAEKIEADLTFNNQKLSLNNLFLKNKAENLEVKKKNILYDLAQKKLFPNPLELYFTEFNLNNGLKYFGEKYRILKGNISGKISLEIENKSFRIKPHDHFHIKNFILTNQSNTLNILDVKNIFMKNTTIVYDSGNVGVDGDFKLDKSDFHLSGDINPSEIDMEINKGKVDLADFGGVAELGIKGIGELDLKITGPLDNVLFDFSGMLNDFGVLGYQLGKSDIHLALALGDSRVDIKNFDSIYGQTNISGQGIINYGDKELSLGINSSKAKFQDLRQILKPIFKKINFLPEDLAFDAKVDTLIYGKLSLEDLKVKSEIKAKNIVAYNENINSAYLNLRLEKNNLEFRDILISNEKGHADGEIKIGLISKDLMIDVKWDNIWLNSLNNFKGINLNGYLVGSVKGKGKLDKYNLNIQSILSNTTTSNLKLKDSELNIKMSQDLLKADAKIFEDQILINWNHFFTKNNISNLSFEIDLQDLKPLLFSLVGVHSRNEDTVGSIKAQSKITYTNNFSIKDLELFLSKLSLKSERINLNYQSEENQVMIKDGIVKKWDFNLKNNDIEIKSVAFGDINKKLEMNSEVNFNAKILDLLSPRLISADGLISNKVNLVIVKEDLDLLINSKSNKLSLTIDKAPLPLNEIQYDIEYFDKKLLVKNLRTKFDSGFFSLKGDAYFQNRYPDVNFKFVVDKAEIPFLEKSSLNLTGEGIVIGNGPPYVISGDFDINKLHVFNELSDFQKKSVSQVRFLPKNQESVLSKLFKLNLNTKFINPIKISNSLLDVNLSGELVISGDPMRLQCDGRLSAPANSSRVMFKNNEYLITNADLNFSSKKDISNPDFDIQSTSMISGYKILTKAYGDLERFNFDLNSEPALPRNSILSLIAFGYTDEIQNTLTQGEQQNLTQVGVGSFVFDRFKISDILNKQFGLQINLGTVFEQSQTQSMLSGRSQDSSGLVGRTRSATKIELKKRLDEAMTLSVSSTMGGSIGQRQSMNLTYNLSKKVQLEGVYELRTNAEGEEDIIDNSIGGDLKFRWTFK